MVRMLFDVRAGEAHDVSESPFGSVGVLHSGTDLKAWWIRKEREDVDPEWTVFDREDFLYVVLGTLRLELRDREPITLDAGDAFVIPAQTPFRGYRWPRESEDPCLFIAVSRADVGQTKVGNSQGS